MKLDELYQNRFEEKTWTERNKMWRALCESFFNKFVKSSDDILDIAAGYCDFINNIACPNSGRRIAVDLNPDIKNHARNFVEVHNNDARDLNFLGEAEIDAVFTSNFFEHIRDKEDIIKILNECLRVLKPGGKIMLLQPNIKYVPGEYWDFFDHYTPLTEKSMVEALELAEFHSKGGVKFCFKIQKVYDKFLPYTTKSRYPKWPSLIKIYCKCPLVWKLLGKQFFILAQKEKENP